MPWMDRRRRQHPRYRTSTRWWIVERTPWELMLLTLGVLVLTATLIALGHTLASNGDRSVTSRLSDVSHLWNLVLETLRACVGTDSMATEEGNTWQEFLATVASLIGAIVPATLIGIVFVKLFTVRPFIWRKRASICLASQADFRQFASRRQDSGEAIIAVRFYNRLDNLSVVDLSARARKDLTQAVGVSILVRLNAKAVGLGTAVIDERWFDVDPAAGHFELGRFVPVDRDPDKDVWQWDGWSRFDDLLPDEAGDTAARIPGQPGPPRAGDSAGGAPSADR